MFRCSGVRAVKVFTMAMVVQVVQAVPVVSMVKVIRLVIVVMWSGGQVVRLSGRKSGQGGQPG